MRRVHLLAAAAATALPALETLAAIEIRHDPLACVPMDRFARVTARFSPGEAARDARLQFRTSASGGWYSVPMRDAGGEWTAELPRPRSPLEGFEYRIVMTSAGSETAETKAFAVRVADATTPCRTEAASSPAGPIVVTVPTGAPVVPPVPPGFNPVGVMGVEGQIQPAKRSGAGKWALLGGVAVAGGAGAALAASGDSGSAAPRDLPSFSFLRVQPDPGEVISLSRDTLMVFVRMSRRPETPLTFDWSFELRQSSAPGAAVCLFMAGTFSGAQDPLDLVLAAPVANPGTCGSRFSVSEGRLNISVAGTSVLSQTIGLPMRFEP